jgi:hypothetical protein
VPLRADLPVVTVATRKWTSPPSRHWAWTVATIKDPEFQMVVLFCAVGLWLTFCFMHDFSDFVQIEPIALLP